MGAPFIQVANIGGLWQIFAVILHPLQVVRKLVCAAVEEEEDHVYHRPFETQ